MKFRGEKAIAFLMAGLIAASAAGCSGQSGSSSAAASKAESSTTASAAASSAKAAVTYPISGGKKLSIAWQEYPAVTAVCKWADTPFIKELEKETGVELEIQHPTDFNVLFASGNCPDLMYYAWATYTGGAAKAISDKVIIPVQSQLEANAPDYLAELNSDTDWQKQATTPNGDIFGFAFIRTSRLLRTSVGLIIRKDWLDDLNLKEPQTPDEVYSALVAFRDQKNAKSPLTMNSWLMSSMLDWGLITSPFGLVCAGFYQKDGKIHYGYTEDAYKDVLTWLHKLYADGLLDQNFLTLDNSILKSNMLNGVSGMTVGAGGGSLGAWLQAASANGDTKFNLEGLPSLVAKDGDKAFSGICDPALPSSSAVAISANCKDVTTACQFLNYGYTKAGNMLYNYGIEGQSYTMQNGQATYTDSIKKNSKLTFQQALAQYCLAWDGGPFGQEEGYIKQYFSLPQQQTALTAWTNNDVDQYTLPVLNIASDSLSEYSSISGEVNTCISENMAKFVTGERSLDEFSKYQSELKTMGVEKLIAMEQKALDEYNSRK